MSKKPLFDKYNKPSKARTLLRGSLVGALALGGGLLVKEGLDSTTPQEINTASVIAQTPKAGYPVLTNIVVAGAKLRTSPDLPLAPDGSNAPYSEANVYPLLIGKQELVAPQGFVYQRGDQKWVGIRYPKAPDGYLYVDATLDGSNVMSGGIPANEATPIGGETAIERNHQLYYKGAHLLGEAAIQVNTR